jgi:anti-anti-sigma factor
MLIKTKQLDQATIATINGKLDGITSVEVQKQLFSLLEQRNKQLILDVNTVDYLSSAGMRALILVAKRAKEVAATICLINVSPQLSEIFEITGFLSVLTIYKDLDTALKGLRVKQSPSLST